MSGKVTVQVQKPDGTRVPGVKIVAINHNAWSPKHKEWHGTTDTLGTYTWPNMDTGLLGDRYTFSAALEENGDGRWTGESTHRIRHDTTITLTMRKAITGK